MSPNYYDPLTHTHCQASGYAPSYWASTVDLPIPCPAPVTDAHYEVAIIGGGFSGLLTAYYLAHYFNISCCVLEANQVGFGASARNAGFVLKGSGRLSYPQMAKKWGMDACKGIYDEFSEAVARVESLITEHNIDCQPQAKGYLKIAHNQKAMQSLKAQASFLKQLGTNDAQFLTTAELERDYMQNQQAFGAMRLADGFGVNPLKLLLGYRDIALQAGVTLYENALVTKVESPSNRHTLHVNNAVLTANNVVYAGNAYNNKQSHSLINNRYLPILSSILVTRPLTDEELSQTGIKTHQVTMDTRTLKYYYRLLPDKRILFGGRGAVFAKHQDSPIYLNNLKKGLAESFPVLANIEHDYYWNGFIAAALDDMPHICLQGNVGYILGYCGAGVSFSAQAAYRMAQMLAKQTVPNLPLYQTPLPYLPFAKFRRFGQLAYYQYAQVKDKLG
ncbi:FAD-binding oxidoreductase [Pseudoalteromonas sp. JBTF-M23]|uniref:FAD-binding oxidoreductase n=1 Tax=Pseudoalteromonas caenipelagi TaxID=2726988 RepID=A0A849VFL1_9GAMM|nr:FAD-dependent oxidoreductase [Pseudoalteromonas caenipelagi]NOU52202.1 FAD-binding oxidoreductase [Pseudoalteromonas caenipelagi]